MIVRWIVEWKFDYSKHVAERKINGKLMNLINQCIHISFIRKYLAIKKERDENINKMTGYCYNFQLIAWKLYVFLIQFWFSIHAIDSIVYVCGVVCVLNSKVAIYSVYKKRKIIWCNAKCTERVSSMNVNVMRINHKLHSHCIILLFISLLWHSNWKDRVREMKPKKFALF